MWTQALEAIIAHATRDDAGGFTPSDHPLVKLTQANIDQLEARISKKLT
jgi:hypothetical protein